MIAVEMGRKLLGELGQALSTGAGVVRHVSWYVSYHMGGRPHDDAAGDDDAKS